MIEAGEKAAEAALPEIKKWLAPSVVAASALKPVPAEQLAS